MGHPPPILYGGSIIPARLGPLLNMIRGSEDWWAEPGFGRRQTLTQIPVLSPPSLSLCICRMGTVKPTLKSYQEPQVRN